ncbi:hypothetical protein MAR_017788 [Mya arenaria]|uniref:Uncharacterized protein n=1 Tax=Mya arenaria TaxID=6604 RepID=A0ABY7ED85_MYAAR|nr:hypothetical protein MAR_017788 [Mya arenaria]
MWIKDIQKRNTLPEQHAGTEGTYFVLLKAIPLDERGTRPVLFQSLTQPVFLLLPSSTLLRERDGHITPRPLVTQVTQLLPGVAVPTHGARGRHYPFSGLHLVETHTAMKWGELGGGLGLKNVKSK